MGEHKIVGASKGPGYKHEAGSSATKLYRPHEVKQNIGRAERKRRMKGVGCSTMKAYRKLVKRERRKSVKTVTEVA